MRIGKESQGGLRGFFEENDICLAIKPRKTMRAERDFGISRQISKSPPVKASKTESINIKYHGAHSENYRLQTFGSFLLYVEGQKEVQSKRDPVEHHRWYVRRML